jgi:hypothetical protein
MAKLSCRQVKISAQLVLGQVAIIHNSTPLSTVSRLSAVTTEGGDLKRRHLDLLLHHFDTYSSKVEMQALICAPPNPGWFGLKVRKRKITY